VVHLQKGSDRLIILLKRRGKQIKFNSKVNNGNKNRQSDFTRPLGIFWLAEKGRRHFIFNPVFPILVRGSKEVNEESRGRGKDRLTCNGLK